MKNDVKYINVPVSLFSGIFKNKQKIMSDFLGYSVYKYSQTMKYGDNDVEKISDAADYFGIRFGNNNSASSLEKVISDAKIVEKNIPDGIPTASLNFIVFWEFYKNPKTEFQLVCFCAFCAIKSILGKKQWCKTNKNMILSRMFWEDKESEFFKKYSTRKMFEKIIIELQIGGWLLKKYSNNTRGIFLSFKKSLEELAYIAEVKKAINRKNELLEKTKQARKNALENVNKIFND